MCTERGRRLEREKKKLPRVMSFNPRARSSRTSGKKMMFEKYVCLRPGPPYDFDDATGRIVNTTIFVRKRIQQAVYPKNFFLLFPSKAQCIFFYQNIIILPLKNVILKPYAFF